MPEPSNAEIVLMRKAIEAEEAGKPLLYSHLDSHEQALYQALRESGLMDRTFDGSFLSVTGSGHAALCRAEDARQAEIRAEERSRELFTLMLQKLKEQLADQKAEKNAGEEQLRLLAEAEKRKQFRHDYHVAAFSTIMGAAFTLLVEHFDEIFQFLKKLAGL